MAYNKADLERQALEAIEKENLVFLNEVIAHLPCSESTFFAKKLEKSESIKEALEKNKINEKKTLRNKWRDSDNATAQIALYRLLSNDEENDKLNGGKQRTELSGEFNVKVTGETAFQESAKKYYDSIGKSDGD